MQGSMNDTPDYSALSDLSELTTASCESIKATIDLEKSTVQLVAKAQAILGTDFEKFHPSCRWIRILEDVTIDGGKVLTEMLNNAEICGGQTALRYVASAICSCAEMPRGLAGLVNTWVKFFLWPFKANISPSIELTDYSQVTPTHGDTSSSQNHTKTFKNKVSQRDGYRCILTKVWHEDHNPDLDAPAMYVEVAHILKRVVATFTPPGKHVAPATRDIIRNYANLTDDELLNIARDVDDPSNGMALEITIHKIFDKFGWILVKQAGNNTYKCESLGRRTVRQNNDIIVFTDHSGQGIPLPNPKFLALHAALGRILHLTGAGDAIDLVMERYSKGGPKVPSSAKFRGPDDWSLIVYNLRGFMH